MSDPTAAATPTSTSASGATSDSLTSDTGSAAASSAPSGQGTGGEPAAPSSIPSSEAQGASVFDFNTLFSASDPDAVSVPEASPATPATPVQPAAGAEPAQPTVPVPAEPTPVQPPVSEPPAAQPSAQTLLDFSEPAAIAQRILSDRANVEAHVAKQLFTLSTEDIEGLETDVVGTIPKLLAKAYVASQTAMLQQLQQVVPLMTQKFTQQVKRYEDNSAKFFKKWPQIDQQKHGDLVYRYGVVYRQMNPQASLDQMISDLGPLVMQAAGIVAKPVAPRTPTAFTPAPNGGAVGIPTAVQTNAFAFMQETGED